MFLHKALSLWENVPANYNETGEFTTSRPRLYNGGKAMSKLRREYTQPATGDNSILSTEANTLCVLK